MSKYNVRFNDLRNQAASLQRVDKTLDSLEERLSTIASTMDGRDSRMATLKSQLGSARDAISPINTRIVFSRHAVENISGKYLATEKSNYDTIDNAQSQRTDGEQGASGTGTGTSSLFGGGFAAALEKMSQIERAFWENYAGLWVAGTAMKYRGLDIMDIPISARDLLISYYEGLNPEDARKMNDFLDPVIRDSRFSADIQNIKYLAYAAPDTYRTVMFDYLDDISIDKYADPSLAYYYRPWENTINVTLYPDISMADQLGGYSGFFHEIGHGIDDQIAKRSASAGAGTLVRPFSAALTETIRSDVSRQLRAEVAAYYDDVPLSQYHLEPAISAVLTGLVTGETLSEPALEAIRQDVLSTFSNAAGTGRLDGGINSCASDVYGGVTGNNVRGGWGHDTEYWDETELYWQHKPSKEFFAQAFSDNVTQYDGRVDSIKENLPKAYDRFEEIVREVAE